MLKLKVKLLPFDDKTDNALQRVGYEFPSMSTCTGLTTTKRKVQVSVSVSQL